MAPLVFWLEIDIGKHACIEGERIFTLIILGVLLRCPVRVKLFPFAGRLSFNFFDMLNWLQMVLPVGLHGILFDHPVKVGSGFMKIFFFSATRLRKIIALRERRPFILLCCLFLLISSEHSYSHFQSLRFASLLYSLMWLLFFHRNGKLTTQEADQA